VAAAPGTTAAASIWRSAWQVPVLAASAVLLVVGGVTAFRHAPKPDFTDRFTLAQKLMDQEKYGEAIETLNARLLPLLRKGSLSGEQARRYHLMVGRSLALGQKELRLEREDNFRSIIVQYHAAEKMGATLDARDVELLGEGLIVLGDLNEARHRADALPAESSEVRIGLYKKMIERSMRPPTPDEAQAMDLLSTLATDPALGTEIKTWTLARQSEILLAQGHTDKVITRILRAIPRLSDIEAHQRAELFVLLGDAHFRVGELADAKKSLDRAAELLGEDDKLLAKIDLLRGLVEFNEDKAGARDRFAGVVRRFADSPEAFRALMGLAESHAWLANHEGSDSAAAEGAGTNLDESIARYEEVAEQLRAGRIDADVTADRVTASALANFKDRFDAGDFVGSIRFARVAEGLYSPEKVPAQVLIALADGSRRQGERTMREGAKGGDGISLAQADPATQSVARRFFLDAGTYYKRHADAVVISDTTAFGSSLWSAADMFDRAGDLESCIGAFQEFANGFPSDQRLPEAKFRLAQARFARGELDLAEKLYRELIEGRTSNQGAGPFADASYVPLARAVRADSDPSNNKEAEELLNTVLGGTVGGPNTANYREALLEIGDLYAADGKFEESVAKFDEFLTRYGKAGGGSASELETARYMLAEGHRLAAGRLRRSIEQGGIPDADRRQMEARRLAHLRTALGLFDEARESFESAATRGPLSDTRLRTAYFAIGDCAFELGDYDGAIKAYDAARERYSKDPSALVALVQIVSAHVRQKHWDKAQTANARAKRFFESLPESVWDDPSLPMGRDEWKRWLDAQEEMNREAAAGESGSGGG
jgi:TolA-binding protein